MRSFRDYSWRYYTKRVGLRWSVFYIDAFEARPLPDKWRVGQKVRYLRSQEFAWNRGEIGYVKQLRKEYAERAANEYQVFYTAPSQTSNDPIWWTTPDDVELVEDHI